MHTVYPIPWMTYSSILRIGRHAVGSRWMRIVFGCQSNVYRALVLCTASTEGLCPEQYLVAAYEYRAPDAFISGLIPDQQHCAVRRLPAVQLPSHTDSPAVKNNLRPLPLTGRSFSGASASARLPHWIPLPWSLTAGWRRHQHRRQPLDAPDDWLRARLRTSVPAC